MSLTPERRAADLGSLCGELDIYLFDQLLRGRLRPGMPVLDAGCGTGRNLRYLLRAGFEVFAADRDPAAVAAVRRLAQDLAPHLPSANFRVEPVEAMTFPPGFASAVLSSAVLHFARDEAHFWAMLDGTVRALQPGGLLFCRLASTIGMAERFQPLGNRRFLLPDRSERFLVDEPFLLAATERIGGTLVDPLKTTIVQDQRCMTTWVLRLAAPPPPA